MTVTDAPKLTTETRLTPTLIALTLARIVVTGSRRFPYLILTPMAAAVGVSRATLEAALSLQWAVGAFSPLFLAPLNRLGRKRVMLIGLLMLGVSSAVATIIPAFGAVVLAIVVGGIAKIVYDPAMQAYIGDRVPYTRRGMAIGITELSWSASLVIFGPLSALLITQFSLAAIYLVITLGSIFSIALLIALLPDDRPAPRTEPGRRIGADSQAALRLMLSNPAARAMLIVGFAITLASELINIAYESWLRDTFALSTVALGLLAWAISAAEVTGEGVVITIADRVGKRRMAIFTVGGAALAYLLLPFTSVSFPAAVGALFLMFLMFEISIVVLIPMATEVVPAARGLMLSTNIAALSIGRACGTLIGGWLLRNTGFVGNGIGAAALNLLAALLIWRWTAKALD